jgi:hypothetical protein
MAGRSRIRAPEPRFRRVHTLPARSAALGHGHPPSIFSPAPHDPTVTRGTPRWHHGGLAERPGARRGPDDRTAEGRRQDRRAWTLLAARPRPSAFRACPVRTDAHLLRSPSRHAPTRVGRDRVPESRPRSRSSTRGDRLRERLASVRLGPSGRSWTSLVSERASHEVPGFGAPALPSALGLVASRSLWRWQDRGVPHPSGGGDPASAATASCWRTECRDGVIYLPVQRHPRPRTLSPRRGIFWGLFEESRSGGCATRAMLSECEGIF